MVTPLQGGVAKLNGTFAADMACDTKVQLPGQVRDMREQ
jgi:hypothetical protein